MLGTQLVIDCVKAGNLSWSVEGIVTYCLVLMISVTVMGKKVTNKKLVGRPAITGCAVNILSSVQGINIIEPCTFVIYDKINHFILS